MNARFLAGLAGLVWVACTAGLARAEWKVDGNRRLEWVGDRGVMVRFRLDAGPRDPHFDILATPDGRNTVWVAPPDHVWHYGLWFSWKKINGVNFWETHGRTGRQPGHDEIVDAEIAVGPESAVVRYRMRAHPDPEGPAVLEDAVEIRIAPPAEGRGPVVDWQIRTRALRDVVLDRTPPPGPEGGREWGGYGGFSWRGAEAFEDVHFMNREGRRDAKAHRCESPWIHVQGRLEGEPAGLLVLDHPDNPRHPQSWYVTAQPELPFWYANPALLQPAPLKLAQGEAFEHRYRVMVHAGEWDEARCEQAAQEFR
jgi:hypothetical protein